MSLLFVSWQVLEILFAYMFFCLIISSYFQPAKRVKVEKHDDDRAQQKHDTLLGPHTLEIDDPDGDDALSENESGAGEDGADERQESRPQRLVDISPYLNLPQKEAAKRLGLPVSTLSKRWKDATHDRKWPYRTIAKIDKEVMQILSNVPEVCSLVLFLLRRAFGVSVSVTFLFGPTPTNGLLCFRV